MNIIKEGKLSEVGKEVGSRYVVEAADRPAMFVSAGIAFLITALLLYVSGKIDSNQG